MLLCLATERSRFRRVETLLKITIVYYSKFTIVYYSEYHILRWFAMVNTIFILLWFTMMNITIYFCLSFVFIYIVFIYIYIYIHTHTHTIKDAQQ